MDILDAEYREKAELGFRNLCSDVTLQTKKQGFFKDYLKSIADQVTESQFLHFMNLKSDRLRIEYLCGLEALQASQVTRLFRSKSAQEADQFRQKGNEAFRAGDLNTALNCYNQSVIFAPQSNFQLMRLFILTC